MGNPLSKALALATGMAIALIAPATAGPIFEPIFGPGAPTVQSDVVRVSDSARIIHRGRLDNDGGAELGHHRSGGVKPENTTWCSTKSGLSVRYISSTV